MARKKVDAEPVLKSWTEVDDALRTVAKLMREQLAEQAELDQQIEAIRTRFEPGMADRKGKLLRIEKDLQEYTEQHKEDLETSEGKRSKTMPHGTVGFRRSTELTTLPKVTWKQVVERIEEKGRKWLKLLRVKKEVAKDVVRQVDLKAEELEGLGMRFRDKDTFGYELNTDETAATIPVDESVRKAG